MIDRFLEKKPHKKTDVLFDRYKRIKQIIWIYFLLLIFEGALRKWIVPELSTPLLVVRDPIALWLIIICFKNHVFKMNFYIWAMWFIGYVAFVLAIYWGHGNSTVALFGARVFIVHFPLIFIIGRVFDYRDVIKMGKAMLWLIPPMTILTIIQFYSPQSSWVNRGVAGNLEGAGFAGALGFYRPPGTFSFTTGLSLFFGFGASYLFFFWVDAAKTVKKWFLLIITGFYLIVVPFTISRTLFLETGISGFFALFVAFKSPKKLVRILLALSSSAILFLAIGDLPTFQSSLEAFSVRFNQANEVEGGLFQGVIIDRFLGGLVGAVSSSGDLPFWGYGIGAGSNAGLALLSMGAAFSGNAITVEADWGKHVAEMGILLGSTVIGVRILLTLDLTVKCIRALAKGNTLPWMLLSFGFLSVLQGLWSQPTGLGFAVLSGGLILAASKPPRQNGYYT